MLGLHISRQSDPMSVCMQILISSNQEGMSGFQSPPFGIRQILFEVGVLRDCIVAQLSSRCLQLCLALFMVISYVEMGRL